LSVQAAACQAQKTAPQVVSRSRPTKVANGGHVTLWFLTDAFG
jgi:hypothetical protein